MHWDVKEFSIASSNSAVCTRTTVRDIFNDAIIRRRIFCGGCVNVCFPLFYFHQIPVACKSCPCGFVFISRKLLNAKLTERASPAIGNERKLFLVGFQVET